MVSYTLLTKDEFSASMAELTSNNSINNNQNLKLIKKILSRSRNEFMEDVRLDLLESYPNIDLEKIPLQFKSEYEQRFKDIRVNPPKRIEKLGRLNFNEFIGSLYDIVDRKSKIISRKLGKIQVSK